jgi:hypothetical protein
MAGIHGENVDQLRTARRRQIAAFAFAPIIVALSACTTSLHDSGRQEATTEPAMSTTARCTKIGSYRIIPSANGSFPLLPVSPLGNDSTPLVRLSSTHLKSDPPTVDVSVALFAVGEPAPKEFRGLAIGQEAVFAGYTIKITSICDKEVLFDLVKQPE